MPLYQWNDHGLIIPATNGGRGSFSYADTAVFGERQLKEDITIMVPIGSVFGGYNKLPRPMIPGGGGGARGLRSLPYGSRAPGFSPNGAVIIRLVKI